MKWSESGTGIEWGNRRSSIVKRTSKMNSSRRYLKSLRSLGITIHFTIRLRLKGTEVDYMAFTTGRIPRLERSGNRGNEWQFHYRLLFFEAIYNYLVFIYLVTFKMVITYVTFLCKYYYYIVHYMDNYINISNNIMFIYSLLFFEAIYNYLVFIWLFTYEMVKFVVSKK